MQQSVVTFPAEWEPQSAVLITWPEPHTDWGEILEEVEVCYIKLATEISKRQILIVCCKNPEALKPKLAGCRQNHLRLVKVATNDTWARDFGGISIFKNSHPALLDFTFNGWGMKFAANHDNLITRVLFKQNIFAQEVELINNLHAVLEGGSIENDGAGTLMTTESCLLEQNRNPWADKSTIEKILKESLGAQRVLWIKNSFLAGDDTDGHIDTLARFCSPEKIAFVQCTDKQDEHFSVLSAMEDELRSFKQQNGQAYELIPLPMAEPLYIEGERLPATYANFLIINDAVLVPTYGTSKDSVALERLQKAFPEREIIGINSEVLVRQHGSLHCITMQFPRGFVI